MCLFVFPSSVPPHLIVASFLWPPKSRIAPTLTAHHLRRPAVPRLVSAPAQPTGVYRVSSFEPRHTFSEPSTVLSHPCQGDQWLFFSDEAHRDVYPPLFVFLYRFRCAQTEETQNQPCIVAFPPPILALNTCAGLPKKSVRGLHAYTEPGIEHWTVHGPFHECELPLGIVNWIRVHVSVH